MPLGGSGRVAADRRPGRNHRRRPRAAARRGAWGEALARLRATGLPETIVRLRRPVLGICVGMQIMCRHTDEGDVDGLGIFDARIHRFVPRTEADKVPHMGWNNIGNLESKLFKGIAGGERVYFVHSYYAPCVPTPSPPHAGAATA